MYVGFDTDTHINADTRPSLISWYVLAENISMAPAQGGHAHIEKCKQTQRTSHCLSVGGLSPPENKIPMI